VKPKVDEQFWFNYSEMLIKTSPEKIDSAAKKLQNLIVWLWGIFTTYSVIGINLQESNYNIYVTILIILTSVSLIFVYWGTAWVQMPIKIEFDPRVPDEIEEGYASIIRKKISRIKIALVGSLFATFMVSLSLVLMSTNSKNSEILKNTNTSNKKDKINTKNNAMTSVLYRELEPIYIYFKKAQILVKEHQNLSMLNKIFSDKKNQNNKYIIKIVGSSSTEIVHRKNTLSDNYQLSLVRANNIKKSILDIVDKNNFKRESIIIDTFAYSNQNISQVDIKNHKVNRSVKIEIIELVENIISPINNN